MNHKIKIKRRAVLLAALAVLILVIAIAFAVSSAAERKQADALAAEALTLADIGGSTRETGVSSKATADRILREREEERKKRLIQIPVIADGETIVVETEPIPVSEVLKLAGVTMGEDDLIDIDLDRVVAKGDEIIITRVTYTEEEESCYIDYEVVYQQDDSLEPGDSVVIQSGSEGLSTVTYEIVWYDGVEVERYPIETVVEEEPVDEIIAYAPAAQKDDQPVEGAPSDYKEVLTCTAYSYSAPAGSHGAYGGLCTYGTCAVDPSVIPLGTYLYIEGYGYAVANDTGGAIIGNTVDVFFEDINDCYVWGARTVKVYVIG